MPKSEANSDNEKEPFEDITEYDLDNENDIKGDFKCLVCEKLFDSALKLSSHSCAIDKEQKENSQFQQESSLESEIISPNEEIQKLFVKDLINQSTKHTNLKRRKLKAITRKSETDSILHTCPECDTKFKSNHRLKQGLLYYLDEPVRLKFWLLF